MKNKVTFSIILPVYNVDKYLGACLDSIYNQSFQDFEIIAINDGSSDTSLDILKDYCDKYGKMVVVSQNNRGLSAARNVGVSHANGEYICYVDSDDVIFPRMLETVYEHLDEKVDFVAYNHIFVEEEFALVDFDSDKLMVSKTLKGCGKDIYMALSHDKKYYNAVWRMCIRKSYLDKIGLTFIEGIYYEDVMYTLICYLKSKYMVYIDEQLYAYRKRKNAISYSSKYVKSVSSYISVLAKMIDYLWNEKCDTEIEECILNSIGKEIIDGISDKLCMLKNYQPVWDENEHLYWLLDMLNIKVRQEAFNYEYYLKGFERHVRNSSGTIIYGAGGIGRMLGQFFKKENMLEYINSYCVTEKKEEVQIEGIEVREIEYIRNLDKDILIIIAANATAREMEKKVRDYGYYNYVVVDRLLENVIYNALNGEE